MKIVLVPSEVLTILAKPVTQIDKRTLNLIEEMKATLDKQTNPQGVGLAAPQVGIAQQIFIIKPDEKSEPTVFINPKILARSSVLITRDSRSKKPHFAKASRGEQETRNKKKRKLEGCLSIPLIWGKVARAAKVYLEYQDLNGQSIKKWFTGFPAIIIQHEMDHLEGILFTQRVLEQGNKLFKEEKGKLKEYEI